MPDALVLGEPGEATTEFTPVELAQEMATTAPAEALSCQTGEALHLPRADEPESTLVSGVTSSTGTEATTALEEAPNVNAEAPAPAPRYKPSVRGATLRARQQRLRKPREADSAKLLPLVVRLVRQRGGFCRLSVVPGRGAELKSSITVSGTGSPGEFTPLQDSWYADVEPPALGQLLRCGIAWEARDRQRTVARWVLGGRDVFVLSAHDELHGYVSSPRLAIGEDHVVLCLSERLPEVKAALAAAGATEGAILEWDSDTARTWTVIDGVRPSRPVPQSGNGDVIDILRPLAEAQLALRGGIRLTRAVYLKDFPPQIRVLGDAAAAGEVFIDGLRASTDSAGAMTVPGWDSVGDHVVSCSTGTKTYRIEEGIESWEAWDAYTWSDGESNLEVATRPSICGMMVRPPRQEVKPGALVTVSAANPVLIGARPGEIYVCSNRSDLRARTVCGYPAFEPVWALPSDPLHCDKRVAKVVQLCQVPVQLSGTLAIQSVGMRSVALWTRFVLDARRKGLTLDAGGQDGAGLWHSYCAAARLLRRRMR